MGVITLFKTEKVTFEPEPRRMYLKLLGYDADELAKKVRRGVWLYMCIEVGGVWLCMCIEVGRVWLCMCIEVGGVWLCMCIEVGGVWLCMCIEVGGVWLCMCIEVLCEQLGLFLSV